MIDEHFEITLFVQVNIWEKIEIIKIIMEIFFKK